MTTVIVWKWVGWRGAIYSADRINTFCRMLSSNLAMPHRIVCITDDPTGVEVETYPLWDDVHGLASVGCPNCFRRLRLFDGAFSARFGERVVSIDVDAVIFEDIAPLFSTSADFKILSGHNVRYNGSLWLLRPGTHQHVWNNFHPIESPAAIRRARAERRTRGADLVGSDQAWMDLQIPDAETWDTGGEILSYSKDVGRLDRVPASTRIMFFTGPMKPWSHAVRCRHPELYAAYMRYAA